MVEGAARRFGLACTFKPVYAGVGAENLFDFFNPVERLDEPRVMVVELALNRPCGQLLE